MSDKQLSLLLKAAVAFLILSVAFCVISFCAHPKGEDKYEISQRIEMTAPPTAAPLPVSAPPTMSPDAASEQNTVSENGADTTETKKISVLDPGHGKSSSQMGAEEKENEGYEYNEARGSWGEWRHYKNGTFGDDCHGEDCTHLAPEGGSCWYPMGEGDRDTEPEITLRNALAAKARLEELGYEVRMTRSSNDENPSMNKRVSFCFPNNDITSQPDATAYICIHSNAGGGRGSSYISLSGPYGQKYISDSFAEESNEFGRSLNAAVCEASGLRENAPIDTPYLILFNKCPVPIAYLEIGFYDDPSDLAILRESSDSVGKAIADAVRAFYP